MPSILGGAAGSHGIGTAATSLARYQQSSTRCLRDGPRKPSMLICHEDRTERRILPPLQSSEAATVSRPEDSEYRREVNQLETNIFEHCRCRRFSRTGRIMNGSVCSSSTHCRQLVIRVCPVARLRDAPDGTCVHESIPRIHGRITPPIWPGAPQLQQRCLNPGRHLMRTTHRPMRPVNQPLQARLFIADQPRVQRLTRHPNLLCSLRYRQTVADHGQHGLIPLLGHAQLPH